MWDFEAMVRHCDAMTALSERVNDGFLVPYAATKDSTGREFDQRLHRFRRVAGRMSKGDIGLFRAQYIGHRLYRRGGLLSKYLKHAAFRRLGTVEKGFLDLMSDNPWRFSFSVHKGSPEKDFHEMEDVFSGESFLLYSKSTTQQLSALPKIRLWLNLVGYNGMCWQSFGPVIHFLSFDPDDIYFYATELNPSIDSDEALLADMDSNPVPYMMLFHGSETPLAFHGRQEVRFLSGEAVCDRLDTERLRAAFKLEYAENVYRITHGRWSVPFDYAELYYDESECILLLTAMTDEGYRGMAAVLREYGVELPDEPAFILHLSMLSVAGELLGDHVKPHPYSGMFKANEEPGGQGKEELEAVNRFIASALPYLNEGRRPDIARLAKEAGLTEEVGRSTYNYLLELVRNGPAR